MEYQKPENTENKPFEKSDTLNRETDLGSIADSTAGKDNPQSMGGNIDLSRSDISKGQPLDSSESANQVELIDGRLPRNCEYAGETYPPEKLSPELQEKYPDSVKFNEKGFPDFSSYAVAEVKIQYSGDRATDYKLANEAAGLETKPKDYTWHHHEDAKTMQLVPRDLHREVGHTGGCATSGLDYNK